MGQKFFYGDHLEFLTICKYYLKESLFYRPSLILSKEQNQKIEKHNVNIKLI
jgi:hypothetical protein